MFYSLFYCSLLLALFPPFGSSTARSSQPFHAPQALSPLAPYLTTTRSTSPSHAPQALSNLAPYRATTRSSPPSHALQALSNLAPYRATTRSSSPSHAPQALPNLAPYRTTTRSALCNHTLHVTLPRPKIPLNTPCFVTRKTMAEGAKKHDDFRLPT